MALLDHPCYLSSQKLSQLCSPPCFPISLHAGTTQWLGSFHGLRRRAPRSFRGPQGVPSLRLVWIPRRLVVVAAKKTAGKGAREGRGEMGLDDRDLMELEFGRLLGEPQDKTLSKVILRKTDPDMTYIEIEKSTKKPQQLPKQFLKSESDNFLRQLEKQQKDAESSYSTLRVPERRGSLPHLTSPPVRHRIGSGSFSQALKVDSTAGLPANKRSPSIGIDSADERFEPFLRKPSFSVSSKKIMSPMLENMKGQDINSIKKSIDDDELLCRPFVTAGNIDENKHAKDSDVTWMDEYRESNGKPIDKFSHLHVNKGQEESLPVSSETKTGQIEKYSLRDSGALDTSFSSLIEEYAIGKVVDHANTTKSDPYEGRFQQLHVRDTVSVEERTVVMDDLASVPSSAEETKEAHLANGAFTSSSVSQTTGKLKLSRPKATIDVGKPGDLVRKQTNVVQQARLSSSAGKLVRVQLQSPPLQKDNTLPVQICPPEPEQTDQLFAGTLECEEPVHLEISLESTSVPIMESPSTQPDGLNSREGPSCLEPLVSLVRPHLVSKSTQEPDLAMASPSHDKRMEQGMQNSVSLAEECLSAGNAVLPTASSAACSEEQERERMKLLKRPLSLRQPTDVKEDEDRDWAHAESLSKSKAQVEVQFVGNNSSGLFVSFGCLVGFLPLFELSLKRNIPEFPVWAQQKGFAVRRRRVSQVDEASSLVQVASSRQNLSEGNALVYVTEENRKDLINKYNKEITELLSSFVGKKAWLTVKTVDRKSQRLRFSEKEADPESQELVQKKASLMAKLNIGDVVTCEVKKITPIGVFVELQGVPALIHHSEISWNAMVDPNYLLRIGEVVKAKVCRLDRYLQRINLSLKQMQPDPLLETLESLVGDTDTSITQLNESEETGLEAVSWPELEALMRKLEEREGIASVLKGRRLRGTALATTFQVFLSAPLDDGYKLLTRFGNEIQEVFVKTPLDRESMKEAIRVSTFKEG